MMSKRSLSLAMSERSLRLLALEAHRVWVHSHPQVVHRLAGNPQIKGILGQKNEHPHHRSQGGAPKRRQPRRGLIAVQPIANQIVILGEDGSSVAAGALPVPYSNLMLKPVISRADPAPRLVLPPGRHRIDGENDEERVRRPPIAVLRMRHIIDNRKAKQRNRIWRNSRS